MAIHTHINWNNGRKVCMDNIKNALEPLISLGFFDKLEVNKVSDDDVSIYCKMDNNRNVFSIRSYYSSSRNRLNISIYLYNEQTETISTKSIDYPVADGPVSQITDVYTTSHGAYLQINNTNTNHNYIAWGGLFISKTNDDVFGIFAIGLTDGKERRLSSTQSWAIDNDPSLNGSYSFPTVYIRNQSTLMNIPTASTTNAVSYFPYIYYTFTSQLGYEDNFTTQPCNLIQNGYRYLWTGYYMLRDDPPIDS